MQIDDSFADGKTDTASLGFFGPLASVEGFEDLVEIPVVDASAVVAN